MLAKMSTPMPAVGNYPMARVLCNYVTHHTGELFPLSLVPAITQTGPLNITPPPQSRLILLVHRYRSWARSSARKRTRGLVLGFGQTRTRSPVLFFGLALLDHQYVIVSDDVTPPLNIVHICNTHFLPLLYFIISPLHLKASAGETKSFVKGLSIYYHFSRKN
jgi:hypothetical protein